MWQLLAIVIGAVLLFYWLAFMATIWWWFNAIVALCKGHFIRATIWGCLGFGMLCWWQGENTIPDPWDFHEWLKGSAWVVGFGALATFQRWRKKQQAIQAIPTMPTWTPPAEAVGNIVPFVKVTTKVEREH